MIYIEITQHSFIDAFRASSHKENFTYEGLAALYKFIDETYADSQYELDIIEICSSYAEYTPDELESQFSNHGETLGEIVDSLENEHTLIKFKGGYIVSQ